MTLNDTSANFDITEQDIGECAIKRFENQVSEQYYEHDILEKCGVATAPPSAMSRTGSMSNLGKGGATSTGSAPSTPRHSVAPGGPLSPTLSPTAARPGEELPKLPSLKVLNSEADALRERSSIHEGYMKMTLEHLSPMLRVLHVFRVMNQVPELAAFYNANRLVHALVGLNYSSDAGV